MQLFGTTVLNAIKLLSRALDDDTFRYSCFFSVVSESDEVLLDLEFSKLAGKLEVALNIRKGELERDGEQEDSVHDLLFGRLMVCLFYANFLFSSCFIIVDSSLCFS
jgi:hypothetical protein